MCPCGAGPVDGLAARKNATAMPRARFIFFAGLESSGHSFWRDILAEFPNRIKQVKELSHLLYAVNKQSGLFSVMDVQKAKSSVEEVIAALRAADRDFPGITIALNTISEGAGEGGWGMMSYPNHGGADKAIQKPDLRLLVEVANMADVDLRIILLMRDAVDIVNSVWKRKFYPSEMQAVRILELQQASLSSELSLIDPAFVACWQYEHPFSGLSELVAHLGIEQFFSEFSAKAVRLWKKTQTQCRHIHDQDRFPYQTLRASHEKMRADYCDLLRDYTQHGTLY